MKPGTLYLIGENSMCVYYMNDLMKAWSILKRYRLVKKKSKEMNAELWQKKYYVATDLM